MPKLFLMPAGRGKRAIVWAAIVFAGVDLAASFALNTWRPELRDPAFGLRLRTLQKRRAENPDAPLVLVLGSSRALHALAPAYLADSLSHQTPTPLVFNFSLSGSGSVRELMMFRRLRAAGINPDWLLIETWPVQWPEEGAFAERLLVVEDELRWTDMTVLSRYLPGKLEFFARALKGNLVPLVSYRSRLLHSSARILLPHQLDRGLAKEDDDWTCTDGTGWLPYRKIPKDLAAQRREVEKGLLVAAPLLNPLRISPDYDRALRELLEESHRAGINTALILMPEHSACRSWYVPETNALVHRYLGQVSIEYHCPVIDARTWAPDGHFADFCHITPQGAGPFSECFGRNVLRPWLQGKPLDRAVLLHQMESEQGR
jgi:hypothetical protein